MTLRAYRCAKGFLRGIEEQVPERWVCGAAAIVQQHVSTEEPAKPIWMRESLPVPCSPPYMSQRQCFQEAVSLKHMVTLMKEQKVNSSIRSTQQDHSMFKADD